MNEISSLAKLKNIHKELQHLIDDISIQNNVQYLLDPINQLSSEYNSKKLKVDLLYLSKDHLFKKLQSQLSIFTEDHAQLLNDSGTCLINNENVGLMIFDEDHFPIKSINSLPTLIKIIYFEDEGFEREDLMYYIQRFTKESIITLVINDNKEFQREIKSEINKYTWKVVTPDPDVNLLEYIEKLPEFVSLINLIGFNLNTKKIVDTVNTTIDNEYKDLSSRKISVQMEHMKLKKMGGQRVGQDLYSQLKTNLQRSFSEFENGINQRFTELTKNQPGTQFSFLMDQIDGIHDLEEISEDNETKYIIPKKSLNEFEANAKQGIQEHLKHDVNSLNDYLSIMCEEIDRTFKENNLLGFNHLVKKMSFEDINECVDGQFIFEKEHEPKSVKKGAMAFLSAVRQPYMLLIMSVGMLAYIPWFKNLRTFIWPFIILALGVGVYFALQKSKKDKEGAKKEEIKRIIQWLKSEYKRIFSNIEKEWKSAYFQHAKTEFSEILLQAENDLKNFQADRVETINTETNLTQRKIQTLEVFDKKLKESQRQKAKVESDLRALATELKQHFLKIEL